MTEKELLELLIKSAKERAKQISDLLNTVSDIETKNVLVENHKKTLEEIRIMNEKLKTLI